jgi:hypothetical protein
MKRFLRAALGAGCLVLSTQAFAGAEEAGRGSFLVTTRADISMIASPEPGGPTRS